MNNYTCYLISNKKHLYSTVKETVLSEEIEFFDGTDAGSFARLVNQCVEFCPTEIVIMMSDKMRPCDDNIRKVLSLINDGYAFVGLYRFGFFGFKKELFRTIGMMDERFIGGGYEDDDVYVRLKEANLAMYLSHEVNYVGGNSSWSSEICKSHFLEKWGDAKSSGTAKRNIAELDLNYNLGPRMLTNFLSWEHTQIHAKKVRKYLDLKIIKE
jgi:GT2 family glycosyltransferase